MEIYRVTKSFKRCLRWMVAKGLLPESRRCPACSQPMRIVNQHSKVKDGLQFRCTRLDCRDLRVGVREGTIFEGNHLTLMETCRVIFFYFCRGFNALQTFRDLKEYGIPTLNYQYVYEIYKKVRQLIHQYFQNHYRRHKLGHYGRAVEIDESAFTHHTKGGVKSNVWVLGFYERGSKDVRAYIMRSRDVQACTQLIRDNVVEGAEIYTDFWRGYNECKLFYKHRVVNKEQHGYGQSEFQTTSRVESLWSILKRHIYTYSTIRASTLQRFLDEACWRLKFRTYTERNEFLI
jgi:IS1 family transposase